MFLTKSLPNNQINNQTLKLKIYVLGFKDYDFFCDGMLEAQFCAVEVDHISISCMRSIACIFDNGVARCAKLGSNLMVSACF